MRWVPSALLVPELGDSKTDFLRDRRQCENQTLQLLLDLITLTRSERSTHQYHEWILWHHPPPQAAQPVPLVTVRSLLACHADLLAGFPDRSYPIRFDRAYRAQKSFHSTL